MGVVNGYVLYGKDLTKDLIIKNELPFSTFMKSKFNMNKNFGVTVYSLVAYTVVFIVWTVIGCFYLNDYAGSNPGSAYGSGTTEKIYSLCDILGN
jgi:hypothetical protein